MAVRIHLRDAIQSRQNTRRRHGEAEEANVELQSKRLGERHTLWGMSAAPTLMNPGGGGYVDE